LFLARPRHRAVPLGIPLAAPKRTWSENTRRTVFDPLRTCRDFHGPRNRGIFDALLDDSVAGLHDLPIWAMSTIEPRSLTSRLPDGAPSYAFFSSFPMSCMPASQIEHPI